MLRFRSLFHFNVVKILYIINFNINFVLKTKDVFFYDALNNISICEYNYTNTRPKSTE